MRFWWLVRAICFVSTSHVIELNETSHNEFIRSHRHSVILYYVPWCHWCQKFLPIYSEIALASIQALKPFSDSGNTPVYGAINVNEQANKKIVREQDIYQYPTLILHDSQKGSEKFDGDPTLTNVLNWVMDKTTTDLSLSTPEQLTAVLELHHNNVIVLFSQNAEIREMYKKLVDEFPDVMFGKLITPEISSHVLALFKADNEWVTDDRLEAEYYISHPGEPFAVLLNPHHHTDDVEKFTYDKTHHEYFAHLMKRNQSIHNEQQVQEFIRTYQFPTVARFTPSVAQRLVPAGKNFIVVFMKLPPDNFEQLEDQDPHDARLLFVEDWLWLIGGKHRHHMVTLMSGTEHFYERRLMSTLSVEHAPELIFVRVGQKPEGNVIRARYRASEDLKSVIFLEQVAGVSIDILRRRLSQGADLFEKWLQGIMDGTVDPDIKSEEPIPEELNSGPVRMLCAKTFDNDVYQSPIDIVVDFYAPWCGHCRVMAPVYERVAKAFKQAGIKDIRFAKIDATANELPQIVIRGYPTVAMFSVKSGHRPMPMPGPVQKPQDLVEFVYQTASNKFNKRVIMTALAHPQEDEDLPKLAEEL